MAVPTQEIALTWSAVFQVAPKGNKSLPGDKILLPPSALEQLLSASTISASSNSRPLTTQFDPFNPYSLAAARAEQSQWRTDERQLPYPLTFRLVNTRNGNVVHAGIREFSADEGEVGLSTFLLEALGITAPEQKSKPLSEPSSDSGQSTSPIDLTQDEPIDLTKEEEELPRITVHAKQLPKGTYVRLRPLEAGYNPEDWKALLERHLRENFTTLTNGEILTVRASKTEEFRFLIDKFQPEGDGICVVDTDLEVDIEALNEEQARETLKQIVAKAQKAPGTAEGSSVGGNIDIWKDYNGQVAESEYVDFELPSWDRAQALEIKLDFEGDLDFFISPQSSRQRARPRDDEHVFGDFGNSSPKVLTIQPTNIELEGAESLFISVHSRILPGKSQPLQKFSLRAKSVPKASNAGQEKRWIVVDEDTDMHSPDDEQCKNCHQWVPKRTMMLHENFCLRNNILCPHCQNVFQKKSEEWANHWHCEHDSAFGNDLASKEKHHDVIHTSQQCPNCAYEASNLKDLASHRTSLADGARTTDCHLCHKIIRLRDMTTHLKHHDLQRSSRSKPAICRNVNCGRTLEGVGKNGEIGAGSRMGQGPGNDIGLCSICFSPLYANMHDPEGKALRRRVERKYISQLVTGCGKAWCINPFCKTARSKNGKQPAITTMEAKKNAQPLIDTMNDIGQDMYLCTDDGSQKRRKTAEMLAAEGVYELEWCVAALEAETGSLDRARTWLQNWAPKIGGGGGGAWKSV
ncbi:ubiquitin fusion degradation protein UFD1-domain-containing protein [Bisporella sp. PMI_857]|nr:ubiquitin fusion degradation protein UFD1-domain-containing protein [Bisporella sp. PMI_857]